MSTVLQKKDVDALSGKLEDFARSLPEQEQNVLGWILARSQAAANAELSDEALDAVSGGQSLSDQLAQAAGFDSVSGGESKVQVAWTYTF
jgi:hypothetical protein